MIKILFVCHGNICRSPMAEFIFRDIAEKNGVSAEYSVASCATATEEIWGGVGNPVYPPAKKELQAHGIKCDGKKARLIDKKDYKEYNIIVGMDDANMRNMLRVFGGDPENKLHKLMEFTGSSADVSDPWYSRRFDVAYNDIYAGCLALFEKCEKERKRTV